MAILPSGLLMRHLPTNSAKPSGRVTAWPAASSTLPVGMTLAPPRVFLWLALATHIVAVLLSAAALWSRGVFFVSQQGPAFFGEIANYEALELKDAMLVALFATVALLIGLLQAGESGVERSSMATAASGCTLTCRSVADKPRGDDGWKDGNG